MKRYIGLILVVVLLFSMLTGCGKSADNNSGENNQADNVFSDSSAKADVSSGDPSKDTGDPSKDNADSSGGNTGAIYISAGSELTDFLTAITDAEEVFEESLNSIDDDNSIFAQLDRVIMNMSLISLPMYDILSVENLPKEEGKLMLSGYDGIREKNGDEIKFSARNEYTEDDQMNNKSGDLYTEQGTLNTSTNTLVMESKKERAGSVLSRTVLEAVILKDGTCLLQYFDVSQAMREGAEPNTTVVFKRFNKTDYTAIIADMEGKTDFSYDSIVGKGDLQAEAMAGAGKYTITGTFSVKDGNATYTK